MQTQHIESVIISATIGRQKQLPVDLNLILREVGAAVRYTCCPNAFTHFQPAGPVIYLSTTAPNIRTRFMIAHELAHIILRTPAAIQLIENRGQTQLLEDEEDLANRIAGTLLVPDDWVEDMKRSLPTPAMLAGVAHQAGIPISLLVTRMKNAGVDIALIHWRRGKRSWQVIDRPGTPLSLHGCIEISAFGRRALDYLGHEESEVVTDCRVNGSWTRIKGRGFRFGNRNEHAFQFFAPRNDMSII